MSKNIARTRVTISSAEARLKRIPLFKPTALPTISAVGVASPIAHGHAMTSTATVEVNAITRPGPSHIQMPKVSAAMTMTAGTKRAAT